MAGGWNVGFGLQNAFADPLSMPFIACGVGSYSAWIEVIAATPSDMTWMFLQLQNGYGGRATLLDIGTGPAGSESVAISSLALSTDGSSNPAFGFSILLPFPVPAGTRIAARSISNQANNGALVQVIGMDDSFGSAPACCSQYDTYGTVAASYYGTAVDPGGTANTPGAWVQLTASCANDYGGFFLMFDEQGRTSGNSIIDVLVDVAIGPAGSERILLPQFSMGMSHSTTTAIVVPPGTPFVPMKIPAGSRIAVRATARATVSPDRIVGVSFYGARQ